MPTRSIPWPRILAEGFAIVVSILLAFGIQAWWEERQEREEEGEILAGLQTEFQAIEEGLLRMRARYEVATSDIEILLEFDGQVPREVPVAVADSAFGSLVSYPTYEPGQATLEGLIASGRLEQIRSADLRDALNLWQNRLDEIEDSELLARDFIQASVIPYLAEEGMPLLRTREASRVISRPFEWYVVTSDTSASTIYDRVRALPEFRALAAFRLAGVRVVGREVENALEVAQQILRLIEESSG